MDLSLPDTLPLFPLNVVLFPGAALPLHIFEPRYKAMMERCLDGAPFFGIVPLAQGDDTGENSPDRFGTMARIRLVAQLEDGRYHIIVEGEGRFEVEEYWHTDDGYFEARITPLADLPCDADEADTLAAELSVLFAEYYDQLRRRAKVKLPALELPDEPEPLSLVLASVLQVPHEQAQSLLEMRSTVERLKAEIDVVRKQMTELAGKSNGPIVAVPFRPNRWESVSRN